MDSAALKRANQKLTKRLEKLSKLDQPDTKAKNSSGKETPRGAKTQTKASIF